MGKYIAQLGDTEYSYLKMLIGQNVIQVFAPALSVDNTEYESMVFCFSLRKKKKEWINLTNSWLESSNDLSYYKIGVNLSENPYGIQLNYEGHLLNSSSIVIGGSIMRIEIYTKEETSFGDTAVFDKALVFYNDNGKKFCIIAVEAIRDALNFTFDEKVIETEIMGCRLRKTIE